MFLGNLDMIAERDGIVVNDGDEEVVGAVGRMRWRQELW
jgi:hypothetical protein